MSNPMERIALLIPTRGRPQGMHTVVHSAKMTADQPDHIDVLFRLDWDDFDPPAYQIDTDCHVVVGPRTVLSECWNDLARLTRAPLLMLCADDLIFRTQGWDTVVRHAFASVPDRILYLHPDDGSGVWRDTFGTHGFLHRRWIEAVGYFVPPYFSAAFNDTWLNDVANMIGRRGYFPHVIEHMHESFGKSAHDQTYQDQTDRLHRDECEALYRSSEMVQRRAEDAAKLRAVMSRAVTP